MDRTLDHCGGNRGGIGATGKAGGGVARARDRVRCAGGTSIGDQLRSNLVRIMFRRGVKRSTGNNYGVLSRPYRSSPNCKSGWVWPGPGRSFCARLGPSRAHGG